jgi:hypothetical protein
MGGLTSWLSEIPFDKSVFPVEYNTVLHEQRTIGWSQFFQGRVSSKWAQLQQEYYKGFPPIKGRDGTSWTHNILCHVFSQWFLLWDARNSDHHSRDTASQNLARRDQALRELDALYSLKDSVLHRDRSIFFDNIQDHYQKPTHAIRQWLNTYQPLI